MGPENPEIMAMLVSVSHRSKSKSYKFKIEQNTSTELSGYFLPHNGTIGLTIALLIK